MSAAIRLKPLTVCIAIPLLTELFSRLLSGDMAALWRELARPSFAPPAWAFGVVCPLIGLLLGIACYLVWESRPGDGRTQALTFYAVLLVLLFCWSPVFFRFGEPRAAFRLLCALLALAAVTTACFALLDRRTVWLMAPCLFWLVYAAALNRGIAALNGNTLW